MARRRAGIMAIGVVAAIGAAACAQGAEPGPLASIAPGRWELSIDGGTPYAMCVRDPARLTQIRHPQPACARRVTADGPAGAVVNYSCPGAGWGRTEIRIRSGAAVRIDTQGVAAREPFAFTARGRRTGDCGSAAADRGARARG